MARSLNEVLGLTHEAEPPSRADVDTFEARLARVGFLIRTDADKEGFIRERGRHAGCISQMAAHLGAPMAELVGSGAT